MATYASAFVELDEGRNGGWAAGGDLLAEPGSYRAFVRVSVGHVEGVLGPARPWEAARSWVVVDEGAAS